MKDELVSIIMPVFNAEAYVAAAIDSVLGQTYKHWELLAVDDGSEDSSAHILSQYARADARIQPIFLTQNHGVGYARNIGINKSRGRFLCFIDSDDIWISEKLQIQIDFMNKYSYAFTFSSYQLIKKNGDPLNRAVLVPQRITYAEALYKTAIWTTTVCLDLNQVERPNMPLMDGAEDTAAWLTALKQTGYAAGINQILAFYRQVPTSLSHNLKKRLTRMWRLYRQIEKLPLLKSVALYIRWGFYVLKKRKSQRYFQ